MRPPRRLIGAVVPSVLSSAALMAQTIKADPPIIVFSAMQCAGDPAPQHMAITNTGAGALTWHITSTPPAWLAESPTDGTAPSTITVAPHIAGLRPGTYRSSVTLSSNDPAKPSLNVEVLLTIAPCLSSPAPGLPGGTLAGYEVEITASGFAGEFSTLPDCKVNVNGYDRLYGTLWGLEENTPNEDVVYAGSFFRVTKVDYCETKGRNRPGDDERVYCTVSLSGHDATKVELQVYSDSARGAWMKATPFPGLSARLISSGCDPQETKAVNDGYTAADDGGGLSPNGQQIDDTNAVDSTGRRIVFSPKGLPRLRVGVFAPDKANNGVGWTLRVIRKIR